MKSIATFFVLFILVSALVPSTLQSQQYDLGFEAPDAATKLPQGFRPWGRGYAVSVDGTVRHSGRSSIRIERTVDAEQTDLGGGAFWIPAQYEGSTIELRGYLKLQNVESGFVGLLLRIDGESGVLAFDNMQRRGLRGTADWQQYSIHLPLAEEARMIVLGVIFVGSGTVWVDDLQLMIDGKTLAEAPLKQEMKYKADEDKEFDGGSGITIADVSPFVIHNLEVLGKLWGFLKYYHPNIAAGNVQWDYELFRVMRQILLVETKEERNDVLLRWIDKLGKFEFQEQPMSVDSASVKMFPDLLWTEDTSELGQKLVARLKLVKQAKRRLQHYYIGMMPGVGNPSFKREKPYSTMSYPDAGFRLLALFRYWNMIQYFFPYKNLIGEDWKAVLHEFVPKFVRAKDELAYKLALLELIARIHDTHANIWQDKALHAFKGNNFAPLSVKFVEDKAVVVDVADDELGRRTRMKKGDVILSVNDRPVQQIIKDKLPYTPASNYPTQLRMIASDLLRSNDSTLVVNYERDGSVSTATVECYSPERLRIAGAGQKKDTCWKFLNSDVGYLYPGTIKNSMLPDIMKSLGSTKGIVIDMRCYPSDFIVFTLSQYLNPESTPFVKFTGGSILTPGLFKFGPPLNAGGGLSSVYKGKVVVIVNETTISNAEYTTMAFRAAPNTIVLGSTTSAADGNVSPIVLPGGVNTLISGIGVYYPDGRETQRVGIVPDIEVKPTIKGIRENKDELLEKAKEVILGRN